MPFAAQLLVGFLRRNLRIPGVHILAMDTHELTDEKLIVGYGPLAEFLTDNGYPLSKSTMSKYCSPAIDTGPPVEAYWGRLPAFSPSHALAWARARLKPVSASRSRPAVTSDAGNAK
jgi:hypothetical protein